MSPRNFNHSSIAIVFIVFSNGHFGNSNVDYSFGVRPVINLDKNVTISSGDGTADNPYVVGA